MDNILRQLEGLSRHELVWLNTYLAGRLRALPPASVQQFSAQPEVTTTISSTASGGTNHPGPTAATLAPLPERIEALNYSLDPWNAQEPPRKAGRIISNSRCCLFRAIFNYDPRHLLLSLTSELPVLLRLLDQVIRTMLCSLGKASKSVSIFARAPLCKDTCRYCRTQPCDVGIEHDDHTWYPMEASALAGL